MTLDLALFLLLALIAIASALGMLLSRNAVYSALYLVLNLVTVAVFYLLLGAPFIAMAQVTVYAGAIMVLFLFVIMLLGADAIPGRQSWRTFILPITLSALLALETIYLLVIKARPAGNVLPPEEAINATENLQQLGVALFSDYLLPFEIVSILLLAAMVGAIVLTKKEKGERN
ncbi:MAG: NADH-quinone oxidoreductase subunit J [Anaerolineae bacterium]|nr:NADH-quinone oxidoreductase subunit J [Anaerolineales bacterium]RIK31679.1 MAG: NADH-quinone oxidoreductase subunit J [Anaerolineae bacterium]WKZ43649.1 MAG: NADH-quinone oxidoreductase subunit J [Anaerolineales bacterium]WKZ46415.1 MAG: NADH-quinone oxidoreductase subunit J [Anaerolineales bacterium]